MLEIIIYHGGHKNSRGGVKVKIDSRAQHVRGVELTEHSIDNLGFPGT